ncbi:MAG: VWA domain-containing protein [Clostridia bacterium]|nr:VWA domain-containing protein [Clostridia bacterium]
MENNERKNNVTELVFILDRSGSMGGLESDTIGGFNAMLKQQKEQQGEVFVSTVLFDNFSEVLHDRLPLEKVAPLTEKDYYVRGCTALIDAIGGAIKHISTIHKYARPEDVPAHTMFVITTDGYENASHKYSSDEVKKMIEEKKEKCGWEFLFIGANIDAVETAKQFGIEKERAVNYHADKKGTKVVYETVSKVACCMRANAPIAADCLAEIDEDYKSRKKNGR